MSHRLLPRTGLIRLARRILGQCPTPSLTSTPELQPLPVNYDSYEAALAGCNGSNYEAQDIVETVFRKTMRLKEQLTDSHLVPLNVPDTQLFSALCLARCETPDKVIRVLDYGGACGAHYYSMRKAVPVSWELEWHVVETQAMVRKAKEVPHPELYFRTSVEETIDAATNFDLVFSSGALQCVSDPLATLKQLSDCAANHVLLSRVGMSATERDIFTVHTSRLSDNGPGPLPAGIIDREVRYPFRFLPIHTLEACLSEHYEIQVRFEDGSGTFPVAGESVVGFGYLARRK